MAVLAAWTSWDSRVRCLYPQGGIHAFKRPEGPASLPAFPHRGQAAFMRSIWDRSVRRGASLSRRSGPHILVRPLSGARHGTRKPASRTFAHAPKLPCHSAGVLLRRDSEPVGAQLWDRHGLHPEAPCRPHAASRLGQLSQKYAQAIKVAVLDDPGKASVMYTGCYGIGASRVVAAPCSAPHRGFERGSAAGSFKHRARRAAEAEALTREHVMAATEWRTANGKARKLKGAGCPIRHSPFAIRRLRPLTSSRTTPSSDPPATAPFRPRP